MVLYLHLDYSAGLAEQAWGMLGKISGFYPTGETKDQLTVLDPNFLLAA